MNKIERNILETKGVCNSEKFKNAIGRGIISGKKVKDYVDVIDKLAGCAKVEVKTENNGFTNYFYVMASGQILQSGSEYLYKSIENIELDEECVIKEIKTKRGHTYLFNPVFKMEE